MNAKEIINTSNCIEVELRSSDRIIYICSSFCFSEGITRLGVLWSNVIFGKSRSSWRKCFKSHKNTHTLHILVRHGTGLPYSLFDLHVKCMSKCNNRNEVHCVCTCLYIIKLLKSFMLKKNSINFNLWHGEKYAEKTENIKNVTTGRTTQHKMKKVHIYVEFICFLSGSLTHIFRQLNPESIWIQINLVVDNFEGVMAFK